MNKFTYLFVALVSFSLINCSSSLDALDPAVAAGFFANPDGNMTAENATLTHNATLDSDVTTTTASLVSPAAALATSKLKQRILMLAQNAYVEGHGLFQVEGCFSDLTSDGNGNFSGTVNIGCLSNEGLLGDCTGAGTAKFSVEGNNQRITLLTFSLFCPDSPSIQQCDFDIRSSVINSDTISCVEGVCTIDGQTANTNGCVRASDGAVLAILDKGHVVRLTLNVQDSCTKATSQWEDAEGTLTLTCDVAQAVDPCPPITNLEVVSNCSLSRP